MAATGQSVTYYSHPFAELSSPKWGIRWGACHSSTPVAGKGASQDKKKPLWGNRVQSLDRDSLFYRGLCSLFRKLLPKFIPVHSI